MPEIVRRESAIVPDAPIIRTLTVLVVLLGAVASVGGLVLPGLYGGLPEVAAVTRGQDVVTLVTLPLLAVALAGVVRGSSRAIMVWFGLMGYMLYTYIGAAFIYDFNRFFLIYVALFSLSAFALVTAVRGLDMNQFRAAFNHGTPRGFVIGFLLAIAFVLGVGELGQAIQFITQGVVPELIPGTDAPPNFVFALDLGVVVPLSVLGSIGLRRRLGWGYLLSGVLLIKATTMGLALLGMTWFGTRVGLAPDGLTAIWLFIAAGGLALSAWFFRHCRA